jgi:hypothetical protein
MTVSAYEAKYTEEEATAPGGGKKTWGVVVDAPDADLGELYAMIGIVEQTEGGPHRDRRTVYLDVTAARWSVAQLKFALVAAEKAEALAATQEIERQELERKESKT